MAKKKRLQPTAPPMTRGQLSRAARERQQVRNLYTAVFAVVVLSALIVGYSVFSAFVLKPNEEVARVNGETITRGTYARMRRWDLYQQNQSSQVLGSQSGSTVDLTTQLKAVDTEALDSTTLNQLIDNTVLRQKAQSDQQITATKDDLKAQAVKDFLPQPTAPPTPSTGTTPGPAITGTATITPTVTRTPTAGPPTQTPTVTPTLPPVPGGQATAEAIYSNFTKEIGNGPDPKAGSNICISGCPSLSEDDYLNLIVEPRVLQDKVTEKLVGKPVTNTEEIHAQHILTDTEAGALKIIDMLNKGADFTQTANTQSKEQLDNVKNGGKATGGDLGWFAKTGSNYDQTFVDGAFQVATGKYSTTPVHTSFGYHIIKVLERDPHHPLTDTEISTAKTKAYQDWFTKVKGASSITSKLPVPTPLPTQPPAQEPTQPPVNLTPTAPAGNQQVTGTLPLTTTTGTKSPPTGTVTH
jgi:parvulin-like peptidyl-prolyl isomerase